jgi:hypothetical protein
MPGLTVTEKEHWKGRIAKRIDKRIDALVAAEPNLFDRIHRAARERALDSLGLAEWKAELDAVAREKENLERRERRLHCTTLAHVRGVPVEQLEDRYGYNRHDEVDRAIARRQAAHEDELLADSDLGRQILRFRQEKDNLLDIVWLAVSSANIRTLWERVGQLLGDESTPLQREALAIPAVSDQ